MEHRSLRFLFGSLSGSLLPSPLPPRRQGTVSDEERRHGSWIRRAGLLVAAGSIALAAPAGASLPIDDFSSTQNLGLPSGDASNSSFAPAPAAIGGERDIEIERGGFGSGGAVVDVNGGDPPQGQLLFSSDIGTSTILRIVWDGEDNDGEQIDFIGLGPVDLSNGGALDAFEIELDSDLATTLSLRVYDESDPTGQVWSEAIVPVLASTGEFELLEVPFTEFTNSGPMGAADFTRVGAIRLEVAGAPALDLRMTSVQLVPESGAAPLAGLAALALLARGRRR
jgi:hypothetical protein